LRLRNLKKPWWYWAIDVSSSLLLFIAVIVAGDFLFGGDIAGHYALFLLVASVTLLYVLYKVEIALTAILIEQLNPSEMGSDLSDPKFNKNI